MFGNPSIVTRIAVGKTAGFALGLLALLCWPLLQPDIGWMPRIGILLWYTTLGAVIGMLGVFTTHPVLKFPLPWWFRGPLLGGWMNLVLTLFAYDTFATTMQAAAGPDGALASPFWFVAEGMLAGLIIGFLATRFGGEGRETVTRGMT
ncbi:MAG: hypothetical protein QNJ67_03485 [Kiloniellales bacterium]|nr:hypothetical protein [Kiloniellales bacterium]